jgi:peptidyl-prolyl cis-trans isomerase SurA
VAAASDRLLTRARTATAAIALAAGATAAAQNGPVQQPAPGPNSASSLRLPENPQLFGTSMPSVVKATAIVNGEIITQTDVDHRIALLIIANGGEIPADELDRLRQQVLRNLIDESLQIQAAKAEEIKIPSTDIDRALARVASNIGRTPEQLDEFLRSNGSSIRTMRRQIEGELAWSRLQRKKIESFVSVGDEEVKAVLDRLNSAKGTQEFRVAEIFISAPPGSEPQSQQVAGQILNQLQQGASFAAYARQYSEASTAAVGGDLGWVRPEQLPDPLAAAVRQMVPGSISPPIRVQGGFSIIGVQDTRRVLTPDPRDAMLSLKQVSINFPAGMTRAQAEPIVARFANAARNIGGCGGADRIANEFNAELVQSDQVRMRELPTALQQIMLPMQVGQATQPFGSIEEGVRILVICGRDEVDPTAPTFDQVYSQLNEERVNLRARRYLRDLRRDAVIEFR